MPSHDISYKDTDIIEPFCQLSEVACHPITNRSDYLKYKAAGNILDQAQCDSGQCFAKVTWCSNDGTYFKDIQTKADFDEAKAYQGSVKTYNACYPQGKFWCDKTTWTCTPITSRDDYLAHKDALIDSCDACTPIGQFWCLNDYSDCIAITSYDQWQKIDKSTGKLVANCDSCFPSSVFYCDNTYQCNGVNSASEWNTVKSKGYKLYGSSNCGGACGKKSNWWWWLLLLLVIIVLMLLGWWYAKKRKQRKGQM